MEVPVDGIIVAKPAMTNLSLHLINTSAYRNRSAGKMNLSLNYDLPVMVIVAVLLMTIVVATIFGNFLVGLALFKYRSLRTISNYLIGNLALSDFLLATTILPLSSVNECLGYWVFGSAMCYFWLSIDVLYCTASIWNLCIIAFDRFTATLYPIWYHEKRSSKQAAIYICCVWVIAFAICLPPLFGWNDLSETYVYDNVTNVHYCVLYQSPAYVLYSAAGSFYIPFFVTVILYVRIFTVLDRRMKQMRQRAKQRAAVNSAANKTNNVKTHELPIAMTMIAPNNESGNMEETSSKSMFGTDSVSAENPSGLTENDKTLLEPRNDDTSYRSSSDTETVASATARAARADCSVSTVIVNPDHTYDTLQVKVLGSTDNDVAKPANGDSATTLVTGGHRRKRFAELFQSMNLFKATTQKKKTLSSTRRRRLDQREVRATIRMAIIIACFCGCWLGFFIIYVVNSWVSGVRISHHLDAFFFWLGYSNSAMNPVLYAIFNDDFRKAFQKILGCYQRRSHNAVAYANNRRH